MKLRSVHRSHKNERVLLNSFIHNTVQVKQVKLKRSLNVLHATLHLNEALLYSGQQRATLIQLLPRHDVMILNLEQV